MELRFKCDCGKRYTKTVENPTTKQVAEEMHNGFISEDCGCSTDTE